jgi:hypothetical protein
MKGIDERLSESERKVLEFKKKYKEALATFERVKLKKFKEV